MKKTSMEKLVRILTLPPFMTWLALGVLFVTGSEVFRGWSDYIVALAFLVVLPILAYPLQPIVPKYKDMGRDGQRQLAIVMAIVGYIAGIAAAVIFRMPKQLILIYLGYLYSGLLLNLFNKTLKIKASGHACAAAGPIVYLIYFIGLPALFGLPILALVFWSSLRMGRHTWKELAWGCILPIVAILSAALTVSFF